MHEKITAQIETGYDSNLDQYLSEDICIRKNLTTIQISSSISQFLANTDFIRTHALYDYRHEVDETAIENWLQECKKEHPALTVEEPQCNNPLEIGTFKAEHKHATFGRLTIIYQRRYLENE